MGTNETNYWMFRVRDSQYALDTDIVSYGWSGYDLGQRKEEAIQEIRKYGQRKASMAKNFLLINENDIVLMPLSKCVAIGRVISDAIYRKDLENKDESNTYNVEWLVKYYDRTNFSSALQTSLKYRGTFLNLWRYNTELKETVKNKFLNLSNEFSEFMEKKQKDEIEKISNHIISRNNIKFQDTEFEKFVEIIFAINYGFEATSNSNKKEAEDGKDLTVSLDIEELETNLKYNIQVKQHDGYTEQGIDQISMSKDSDPYTRNVVVSNARFNDKVIKYAKEKNVILIGADQLAKMIYVNFDKLEDKYKAKLNLYPSIQIK